MHVGKLKVIVCITCYLHVVCVVRWHCTAEDIVMMFLDWCMNQQNAPLLCNLYTEISR